MKRTRGRPKQYDEDVVLHAAGEVFWTKGFNATSLDDLSVAMGMNRPSIYRAFGDKEARCARSQLECPIPFRWSGLSLFAATTATASPDRLVGRLDARAPLGFGCAVDHRFA
ncbi:MAG TPA: TetR/AcrR family transcriptional regulator, partial [Planctomycetaceae bacterium]|nr:TetR/AcrR family transcriptional regulator [Planctomycetaceae bacterium]